MTLKLIDTVLNKKHFHGKIKLVQDPALILVNNPKIPLHGSKIRYFEGG